MTDEYLPRSEFDSYTSNVNITRAEFDRYILTMNGSLTRIENGINTLDKKIDQSFFQMQGRMDKVCDEHKEDVAELHERIDKHVPKWFAYIMSFMSAACVGLLTALVVELARR